MAYSYNNKVISVKEYTSLLVLSDVPHVFTYFRELLPTAQNGTQQID
uniref:Uncharacterized protein n=1 Tax=Candidatus Kentrum sp. FM TaxID=2126340 RepID=A0A450SU62_9GAMM|nr:MAG: hypothetical protein BECKFM1743C_GA0114222_102016 [Candidatus Kentron sp. FM]VFK11606.1 MAG: hypothetical protein BECKFM1743B_GA0114221_101976 [Candidatus Kentron sp. FM]